VIDVLEECPEGDTNYLFEAEQFWITQIRSFGHKLKNHSEGGASGSYGARWTLREDQIRRGKDHPMYGRTVIISEEGRKKISLTHKGRKTTSAHTRWHVNRGLTNPKVCVYCREEMRDNDESN
jgi:hypothetical protein